MKAEAMKNYHLHHPFGDSPAVPPWPTAPPETVRKLADLTRGCAKATMQAPAEPPLLYSGQQATQPFFQPHAPPAPPPLVPPKRARPKRGAAAPCPEQARKDSRATISQPPATLRPSRPTRTKHPHHPSSRHQQRPTRTKHPHHPPSRQHHHARPKRTQSSKKARKSNSLSATTTQATRSGVRARSRTASRNWAPTGGCKSG